MENIITYSKLNGQIIPMTKFIQEEIESLKYKIENFPEESRIDYIVKLSNPYLKEYKKLQKVNTKTDIIESKLIMCRTILDFLKDQMQYYILIDTAKDPNKFMLTSEESDTPDNTCNESDSKEVPKPNKDPLKPLTKTQACEYMNVSMPTLNKWIRTGKLSVIDMGGRKYITIDALQKMIRENEFNSSQPLKIKK